MINQMFNPNPLHEETPQNLMFELEKKCIRFHGKYCPLQEQTEYIAGMSVSGQIQRINELMRKADGYREQVMRLEARLKEVSHYWDANRKLQESRDKSWKENVELRKELNALKEQIKAMQIVRANEFQHLLKIAKEEAVHHEESEKEIDALDESFFYACTNMKSFKESKEATALDKSVFRICNVMKSLRESNERIVADLQFLVSDDSPKNLPPWYYPDARRNRYAMNQEDTESLSIYKQRVIDNLQRVVNEKTVAVTNLEEINSEQHEGIAKQAKTINSLRETVGRHQEINTTLRETIRNLQKPVFPLFIASDQQEQVRVLGNRLKQAEADKKMAEDNAKLERKNVGSLLLQLKGSEDDLHRTIRSFSVKIDALKASEKEYEQLQKEHKQLQAELQELNSRFNVWLYPEKDIS